MNHWKSINLEMKINMSNSVIVFGKNNTIWFYLNQVNVLFKRNGLYFNHICMFMYLECFNFSRCLLKSDQMPISNGMLN